MKKKRFWKYDQPGPADPFDWVKCESLRGVPFEERLIDRWRRAVSKPHPPCTMSFERDAPDAPITWAIEEASKVIRWREDDVPGLGRWISDLLVLLGAALPLAQGVARILPKQQKAGINSGKKRAGDESKAAAIRREAEKLVAKDFDPFRSVPAIARRTKSSQRYVRQILNGPKISRK